MSTFQLQTKNENIDQVITVHLIRSGQSRPYADTEYLYRVEFFNAWKSFAYSTEEDSKLIAKAIAIVCPETQMKNEVEIRNANSYFSGWVEYAKVTSPGIVEIQINYPFAD